MVIRSVVRGLFSRSVKTVSRERSNEIYHECNRTISYLNLLRPFSSPSIADKVPLGTKGGKRKWIPWIASVPLASVGLWVLSGEDPKAKAKLLWTVPLRLGRNISTASIMIADYYFTLKDLPIGTTEREDSKRICHVRCADHLQRLFFKNGGIYIKLGQHIGQLDHLIPSEYVEAMNQSMLDRCPVSSYPQVCSVIEDQLGSSPEKIFAEFERTPIASASLAQVHRAKLPDGRTVAVKVQHAHLTDTATADIHTVWLLVKAVNWMFPDFDYGWLVDEVQESLPKELDFLLEAENSRKCAENFASSPLSASVAVPKVFPELSGTKVLTMEFVEGVKVTDKDGLKKLGFEPGQIARLVSEAFSEMIFSHGFVHCDPHAANMMVRSSPGQRNPKPQLVLLDHGLYRTLSPEMRKNYAGFWHALIFADVGKIKHFSEALGARNGSYPFFAGIVTMRSWEDVTQKRVNHLKMENTQEEREQLQSFAVLYVKEISGLLRSLPRVVLLLLKTNDCLRSVDNALGAPVNTFVITARYCARAMFESEWRGNPGVSVWKRVRLTLFLWNLELRLLALRWLACVSLTRT